jgi:hypothetical protein
MDGATARRPKKVYIRNNRRKKEVRQPLLPPKR